LAGIVYVVFLNKTFISDFIDRFTKKEVVQEEIKMEDAAGLGNSDNKNTDSTGSDVKRITMDGEEGDNPVYSNDEQDVDDMNREDLERMAASFGERYGSYSNHSNFSNIVDLKIFMSKKMKKWADDYIAEQKSKESVDDIYYGIITKSIGTEILEFNEDAEKVEILVQTRRREAIGTTSNISDVFNQGIIITFAKEMGAWKVDSANWQNK